ncbi:ABC transporter substrate-binding protein [Anaerotruncus colihominis]|uniref:ABC transporter substrate-binding protein n=1 Tax=Anaerotruncus colihominis TaxID=169435 RepID=UPI00189783CA|nr:ABC transporter substrate-binding protein [Anaerotruncus colihominis]
MKKRWKPFMAVLLSVTLLAGCSGQVSQQAVSGAATASNTSSGSARKTSTEKDTILIGVSASITGSAPTNGMRTQQGAQMAVDEINEAGGVLGKQLELFVADDGGVQDTGINATNLIASQGVVAQVGPTLSGLALAVEGIISEAEYPVLVGATSPKLVNTIDNPWLFRVRASDTIQAQLAAVYATENLGCSKIGLFTNSNDYGSGARVVVEEYLTEKGIEYVSESHNTGDTDMTSQVLKLKEAGVDCVIVWTDDAETALAARQFYDLGLDVPIIGSTSISTPQVNELCQPEWLDNWYSCTDFTTSNDSEIVQNFVKSFNTKYGEDPELYAVTYYSAIYLLKDAIERAGSLDSAAIRDALAATDGLQVPIGTYKANEMREMVHGGTICKMVDGKAEFLEYVLVKD